MRHVTIERARVSVNTTRKVEEALKTLVSTGYYGNSVAEAAERILCEALRSLTRKLSEAK